VDLERTLLHQTKDPSHMRITTVSETNPSVFDRKVNQLLKEGWELHGPPSVQTVPRHNTWDGRPYSIPETTYTQVFKQTDRQP